MLPLSLLSLLAPARRRRSLAGTAAALLAPALLLAACSGEEEPEQTPEDVLAAAKTQLDETPGVRLGLEVDDLPGGVNGLLAADGVATRAPAFEGSITVSVSGVSADVEVIAADGAVFAVLPFTTEYAEIDPADYGAPDPATLIDAERGVSSLLTAAEEVAEGEQVRDGEEVLSAYTGVVPGEAVASVIPSADPQGSFDATFTVSDDDRLTRVVLTGPFYPDAPDATYTIDLDDYGTEQDISAP